MEKFVLGLFLFYALAAVCRVNSLLCYQCVKPDKQQCEKDRTVVYCNFTSMAGTCMKTYSKTTDGKESQGRACTSKQRCDNLKDLCDLDKDTLKRAQIQCTVVCCQTDLCNSPVVSEANSFKCYQCTKYDPQQCEQDQTEVHCHSTSVMPKTCMKSYVKRTDGEEIESRTCATKTVCEEAKKQCEDKDVKNKYKIESCAVACCQTDLCNSAVAIFAEVAIMIIGSLCVFMLV